MPGKNRHRTALPRGKKPVHLIQLELLRAAPYHFDHETLVLESELLREPSTGETRREILTRLRSRPLPCLRTSPLAKRYGWGFHFDAVGKVAAYAAGSEIYAKLAASSGLQQIAAVRSKLA